MDRAPVLVVVCAPVFGPAGDEPTAHLPIDCWREWRRVREAVTGAVDPHTQRHAPLELVRLHPPTIARLRAALHAGRASPAYPMVHIVGYVPDDDGSLRMEQDNGREEKVTPDVLVSAFQSANVQLVLLNVCSGLEFGRRLVAEAGVRAVVTTRGAISDPEATLLAAEIYRRLAFGDSIGEAWKWAQESMVEAYRRGLLPPLDDWSQDSALDQYGRERAENVLLEGDPQARLPLPAPGSAAPDPRFELSEPPNNLPHPEDLFAGRGRELVQLSDCIEERQFRSIVLTGAAGTGKSSLAISAALRNSWRFQGVIYFTARDAAGDPQELTCEAICRQCEAVLGLGASLSTQPTPQAQISQLAGLLNAHPYLLVFDNLESLSAEQAVELAQFLQLVDPRSGTAVLLTLRPEQFPPLVDQSRGDFYHLRVAGLDPADALLLLSELLRPRVEGGPPHGIARGRLDEPPALAELAEAADRSPSLLRIAVTLLKQPEDRDTVLGRLRELSRQSQQQAAPPRRPAAPRSRMRPYLVAGLALACLSVIAYFAFSGSRWPVVAHESFTREGDKYRLSFVLTNPAANYAILENVWLEVADYQDNTFYTLPEPGMRSIEIPYLGAISGPVERYERPLQLSKDVKIYTLFEDSKKVFPKGETEEFAVSLTLADPGKYTVRILQQWNLPERQTQHVSSTRSHALERLVVRSASETYKLLGSVETELASHLLDIQDIATGIGAPAGPWPEGSDGSFVGVGLGQTVRDGKIVVTDTLPDSPAARAGIRAADVIVGIGDTPGQNLTDSAVSELLRGAAGTPVKLVIARPGVPEPLTFTVLRERIPADAQVLIAAYPDPKLGKRACFVIDRKTALVEVEDKSELSKAPLPTTTNPLLLLRGLRNLSRRMARLVSDEREVGKLRRRFDRASTKKWALYGLKSRPSQ